MNQSRNNHSLRPPRGGFTLVELLVAMTVTLILIFALAQAFAVIGESVAKGRAAIEMSGNLRMVSNLLQQDLQGITVPVRPVADDRSGGGYLEILDGPSTDKDWNADGAYDINPTAGNTTYGDVDDVIAFTTRNAKSPFFGTAYHRGTGTPPYMTWGTYQSSLAEVVWWIQFLDRDGSGVQDTGEPYLIYRRAMMIRPDLVELPTRELSSRTNYNQNPDGSRVFTFGDGVVITRYPDGRMVAVYPNDVAGYGALRTDLLEFYNRNDISVHIVWWLGQNNATLNVRMVCNSLADLTKRESRYAHVPVLSDRPAALELPPVAAGGVYPPLLGPVFPFRLDTNRRSVTSLYRNTKHGANQGEDVMVSDALAFDVQVFDPQAPLLNWNTGDALVPSDPAYFPPSWTPGTAPPTNANSIPYAMGYGAFVDLGYGSRMASHAAASGWSLFSGPPDAKSQLYTPPAPVRLPIYDYCTWSNHYESNGIDEDGDSQVDEGTNGFDDPVPVSGAQQSIYGVDDVGERETSPPYPVPLRGVQIRIRAWDPDSRQIRQATVVSDFVPE